MSRYTIYNLVTDINGKLHSGAISQVDVPNIADEGRRNFLRKVKPAEMVRSAFLEQALYPKVDKYAVPDDMKYEAVVNIRKLSSYRNLDDIGPFEPLAMIYRREFDQKRRRNVFAINWENGVKTMSINDPRGLSNCNHLTINEVNSLTENGSWNVGGNVVNLRLDELNHITKTASLSFDINGSSTTGFIANYSMDAVDINDYLAKGAAFSWLSLPIPKEMTSVRLLMGSDVSDLATDYYSSTVNQPHDNNAFINGWNLLKFMLNNLNQAGTPNPKAITWIRWEFTTTGEPIPGCNLNSLVVRKGEVYEAEYNSAFCIIDAQTGAWKQRTTANSDILPFEEDTYQVYMLECALVAQKQIYGNNAGAKSDVTDIENELKDAYVDYRRNHKAEFIEPQQYTNQMGRMNYGYGYENEDSHCSRNEDWFTNGDNCDPSPN